MLRRIAVVAVLAGCSFTRHPAASDDGDVDAPPVVDDAGREIVTWDIDSAAAFSRTGSLLLDMVVEPWGSLSPIGYFHGTTIGQGANSAAFNALTPDNQLLWAPQDLAGTGGWDGADLDPPTDILTQFGITGGTMTLWLEGELFLPAGAVSLHLRANDVAFLELAPPHSAQFAQVAVSRLGLETTVSYNATAAGWHPFRIGWANAAAALELRLAYSTLAMPRRAFDRTTIRARTGGLRGFARAVADHQLLADGHPIVVFANADGITDAFATPPPGAGAANTRWSARYTGQFYAPVAGDYALALATDDGHRLISGAVAVSPSWGLEQIATPSETTTLAMAPGWNDLVVDYNQVDAARSIELAVASAPAGDAIAGAIPASRLRPVEPRAERLVTGADTQTHVFADNNATGTTATAALQGMAGETITSIDVSAIIVAPRHQDLEIELRAPNTQTMQLANNDLLSGGGRRVYAFPITDPDLIASMIAGDWLLTVRDDVSGGGGGQLEAFYVTVRTTGGNDQIARKGEWSSEIVDNPTGIAQFDDIRWTSRGTPAVVELRTCDAPCTSEPWVAQTSGTAPALEPRRYIQARVELTSDGVASPELEQLVITYRRNAK